MTWWILGILAFVLIFFWLVSLFRVNSHCEDTYNNIMAEKEAGKILVKSMHSEGVNLTENASDFYIERLDRNLFKFKRLSDGKYSNEYACVSKYINGNALAYKNNVGWCLVDKDFNEEMEPKEIAEFFRANVRANCRVEINAGIVSIL